MGKTSALSSLENHCAAQNSTKVTKNHKSSVLAVQRLCTDDTEDVYEKKKWLFARKVLFCTESPMIRNLLSD